MRVIKKGGYNRTSTQKRVSVEVAIALLDIPDQVSFFMIDPVLNTVQTVWLMVDYFILIQQPQQGPEKATLNPILVTYLLAQTRRLGICKHRNLEIRKIGNHNKESTKSNGVPKEPADFRVGPLPHCFLKVRNDDITVSRLTLTSWTPGRISPYL